MSYTAFKFYETDPCLKCCAVLGQITFAVQFDFKKFGLKKGWQVESSTTQYVRPGFRSNISSTFERTLTRLGRFQKKLMPILIPNLT